MDDASRRWCLVMPVKRLAVAKTRLGPPYDGARGSLALAFALDTATAALACPLVAAVQVVTDDAEAARALEAAGADVTADEPDAGLNAALEHGAALAARRHPGTSVGTLAADLPGLRPAELGATLRAACGHGRSFVRDAAGTRHHDAAGPLGARTAADVRAGIGRAARRAPAATRSWPRRCPRCTWTWTPPADLEAAVALGVGPATAQVLDALGAGRPRAG